MQRFLHSFFTEWNKGNWLDHMHGRDSLEEKITIYKLHVTSNFSKPPLADGTLCASAMLRVPRISQAAQDQARDFWGNG
jgi:hypothetical protein